MGGGQSSHKADEGKMEQLEEDLRNQKSCRKADERKMEQLKEDLRNQKSYHKADERTMKQLEEDLRKQKANHEADERKMKQLEEDLSRQKEESLRNQQAYARQHKELMEQMNELMKQLSIARAPPANVARAAAIKKEAPEVIIKRARTVMGVDCVNHYNFVVSGQTGVGKSSFINGALCLEGDACASVGETETTSLIKSYSSDKFPNLKLWDVPGAGTRLHPASTYFEQKQLFVFDAILILCADRFLEVDFHIIRSAREFDTPCVFVRTKCELAVRNRAKRDKVNAFEAARRVRADVSKSLLDGFRHSRLPGLPPQLFLISNEFYANDFYTSPSDEHDPEQGTYCIDDKKTKTVDTSLPHLDEKVLVDYLVDLASQRGNKS